jgi:uncharacterized membrane protein
MDNVSRSSTRGVDATQNWDRALAAFSIGLGLAEVLAPRWFGRVIGAGEHPAVTRLCGLREIAAGVGLLSTRTAANAAAARLAGDVLDVTLLGIALARPNAQRGRLRVATAAVLGAAAADAYLMTRHARTGLARPNERQPVSASIAINASPENLYTFWRDVENLPRFMSHLESVTRIDDRTSTWVAKAPAGSHAHWQSEIVEERPNELIAWRTLPGSGLQHQGRVTFKEAGTDRGCFVHVEMVYAPPGGGIGSSVAKALGEEPELQIRRDLRALKQILETGEVATTRGQASGQRSVVGKTLTRREP